MTLLPSDDELDDGEELTPRDRAELLIAGTLAGASAPKPVELTRHLLKLLEAEGLAITGTPAPPPAERYDPHTKVHLTTADSPWPLVASLCQEDGTLVVDRGRHDNWHDAQAGR